MGKGRWMKENGMQCNWAFRWEKNQTYAWTYRRPQSACRCRGLIADEALPEEPSSKPPWINISGSGILARTGKRRLPLPTALQWAREREGEIEERRNGGREVVEVNWWRWYSRGGDWRRLTETVTPLMVALLACHGARRSRSCSFSPGAPGTARGKKRRCLCPISWPGARQPVLVFYLC